MKTEFVEKLIEKEYLSSDWPLFSGAFQQVEDILKTIVYESKSSHPATENIFRAFNECPVKNLKVVILGQDPYHDGSATGLAFDNRVNQKKISPSLKIILKGIAEDMGMQSDGSQQEVSYLEDLPTQGVLLVNTALTVQHGKAGSHAKLWKPFTEQLIKDIQTKDNIVWILWGNHAKSYKKLITNETHHIIEGGHPSPLNTSVPFAGGKYFSKCNEFLKSVDKAPIQW